MIGIQLAGIPTMALIDTGAAVSLIDHRWIAKQSTLRNIPLAPTHFTLNSASEHSMRCLGRCSIPIQIAEQTTLWEFVVTPTLTVPVILGHDFLQATRTVIDLDKQSFTSGVRATGTNQSTGINCANTVQASEGDELFEEGDTYCVITQQAETVNPHASVHCTLNCRVTKAQASPDHQGTSRGQGRRRDKCACNIRKTATVSRDPRTPVSSNTGAVYMFQPTGNLAGVQAMAARTIFEGICEEDCMSVPLNVVNPNPTAYEIQRNTVIGHITVLHPVLHYSDQAQPPQAHQQVYSITHNQDPAFPLVGLDLSKDTIFSSQEQALMNKLLQEHADIFATNPKKPGRSTTVQHYIDTQGNRPIRVSPYRVSQKENAVIQKEVAEMLRNQIIRPSQSPWAFPVVLVAKKDGSTRFCVNYRKLNALTKRDSYPLPRVDDYLDQLGQARYLSTLDMASGYWAIPLAPGDAEKTAFTTKQGLFQFEVMPFGLTNAPATFQRYMDTLFRGLTYEICLVYMDDVIIYSSTFDQHVQDLTRVFARIREAGLTLKASKCEFGSKQVNYLGYLISPEGVRVNQGNLAPIFQMPTPTTKKQIQSFLGMAGYYRRFIPKFADIVRPLTNLTKGGEHYTWTPECQAAFQTIKAHLTKPPILAYPDFTLPFELHTDASNDGLGATLVQHQAGQERVISYASRTLKSAETRYSTTEKECLAIVWAIKMFRPYLHGTRFTIVTDHQPLTWLFAFKDPVGRPARWALQLQGYDYECKYRPGNKHTDADGLSRLPQPGNNTEQINVIARPQTAVEVPIQVPLDLAELRTLQHTDEKLVPIIQYLETGELPKTWTRRQTWTLLAKGREFVIRQGVLCKATSGNDGATTLTLVVPEVLQAEIIKACHDEPLAAHLGVVKTYDKVRRRFFWENMFADIQFWIQTCPACGGKKSGPRTWGQLQPITVDCAFDLVGVDILGPLPQTPSGATHIVVFSDYFTKWVEAGTTNGTPTSESVADLLIRLIITRHGAPHRLLSDQGSQFLSKMMQQVYRILRINKRQTTAYHPQCDGLVERFNRTLTQMLSMVVDTDNTNWDRMLPLVLFAYRTSKHEATQHSPFELLYGRQARLPMELSLAVNADPQVVESLSEYATDLRIRLQATHEIVKNRLQQVANRYTEQYRKDKRDPRHKYQVEDQVWLYHPETPEKRCPKFLHRWYGPYKITHQPGPVTFTVQACDQMARSRTVHISRLKPYKDSLARPTSYLTPVVTHRDDPNFFASDNEEQQDQERFEVEAILSRRVIPDRKAAKNNIQYLIKWKGYPDSANTWEPEENLDGCQALLREFLNARAM
jgi:hypothetical protein